MVLTMVVSFLVARTVPETVNRDLQILTDAVKGEARPGLTDAEELRTHKIAESSLEIAADPHSLEVAADQHSTK
jgi:hypothetical protein